MPITANYSPAAFTLTVTGTTVTEVITVQRNAAGNLLVNGGAVPITGGTPTIANTDLIVAFGGNGNDTITLDETNGALPSAELYGGAGVDTMTGGSGADILAGEAGNDTLFGRGGADQLYGGDNDDVLTGGDGDDQMFGEAGNDTIEGQDGTDTLDFSGSNANENINIIPNGGRVLFLRDVANVTMDMDDVERILFAALGGADNIVVAT